MRCYRCGAEVSLLKRASWALVLCFSLASITLGFAAGFLVNNYQIRVWQSTESARFQQAVDLLLEKMEKR